MNGLALIYRLWRLGLRQSDAGVDVRAQPSEHTRGDSESAHRSGRPCDFVRRAQPRQRNGRGLGGLLGGLLGGGFGQTNTPQITPEQASPEAAEHLAREAKEKEPDIINRVSDFAAANPTLVKGLGPLRSASR
jgi:hypothetical protein